MSKHDFTAEEFEARRARVREALARAQLDWLIAVHPVSIHWLTGSDAKSYQEFQCLFIPARSGPLCILTRQGEQNEFRDDSLVDEIVTWGGGKLEDPLEAFESQVARLGLRAARVGLEVPAYYLHPHHYAGMSRILGRALAAEPTNLIHNLKAVKSATEQSYIRQAARLADQAMRAFAGALAAGRTELELAGVVYHALLINGSGLAASPINLVSGERSCFSHGAPTSRKLRTGDFGNIEYGATWRRYTSTLGRQFCLGTPTQRMRELYQVARDAADACISQIRAGVPACVPHRAAQQVIAAAGLEHARVHTTGYGLAPGFPPTWGEPLHMLEGCQEELQAGMVLTVEPPVFVGEQRLGARLIDNVLVTRDGAELLSQFSRELIVVA